MARIRSIKPEFWASEQVMESSPIARLLFIGLWNFCDDGGNHVDSAKTIKAEIFPGDDISSADVRRMLDELSSNGLIVYYTSENKGFLHVTGWHHQKIDRPTMKHPPYRGDEPPGARRVLDDSSPPEWRGEEGRGEEQSSLRSDSSPASPADLLGEKPQPVDLKTARAERLAQVTDDAITAFNASDLVKPNGGRLATVSSKVGRENRQKQVNRCLRTARAICQQDYGSQTITPEFWRDYWRAVHEDDFHAGRQTGGRGHENWLPDFEFLTREATMLKVYDRASSEDAA